MSVITRKDVQDDNNYINKYGKITHICTECGKLYTREISLNVECMILTNDQEELNTYRIETPEIHKTCECGYTTIQIDNAMGNIVKTLIDKGYELESCCEGHCYITHSIPRFDFPYLAIKRNIKPLIEFAYCNKFIITANQDLTVITCNDSQICPCVCKERFDDYKTEFLETLENLVKALPDNPFNNVCSNTCCCR